MNLNLTRDEAAAISIIIMLDKAMAIERTPALKRLERIKKINKFFRKYNIKKKEKNNESST